jgi:hypothetical protein
VHRLGLLLEGGCLLRNRFGSHRFGSHRFGSHRFGSHRFGSHRFGRRRLLNRSSSIVRQLLSFGRLAREEEHA